MINNKNIRLTVAIPVYNSAKHIRNTLDSIINQTKNIEQEIEIVVSDNASTDETQKIIENYQKQYPFIRYFRNEINVGFDKNVDLLFKRAQGKYIWTLGDKEILKPHILYEILQKIKNDYFSNILINFEIYSEVYQKKEVENNFGINKNIVFYSKKDFFKNFKFGITPLSANIILKKAWEQVDKNPLLVEGWCHVERIIDILSHPNWEKSLYIGKICFTLMRDIDGWWTYDWLLFHNTLTLRTIIKNTKYKGWDKNCTGALLSEIDNSLIGIIKEAKKNKMKLNFNIIKEVINTISDRKLFSLLILFLISIPNSFYILALKMHKNKLIRMCYRTLKNDLLNVIHKS